MKKIILALLALFLPALASAHEVYVLSPEQIMAAYGIAPFNMLSVMRADLGQFIFWGAITAITICVVFYISTRPALEGWLDAPLARLRRFAAPIARVTVGLSFIAAAYYQASYGPELPLSATFGVYTGVITVILIVIGALLILGLFVRAAAAAALVLFGIAVYYHGIYMLTYTNYLGEVLVLLILGAHHGAHAHEEFRTAHRTARGIERWLRSLALKLAPYSFVILRICFGISLFYASLYAKVLHNNLALMVASLPLAGHEHNIASILGFEPHFLVLGAAIIEILIALFFIFGIEIRFTSFFLLFWLSLSLWYFGEVVWPHVILIGIPIAFICYGYDNYSLEGRFFKHGAREPVL